MLGMFIFLSYRKIISVKSKNFFFAVGLALIFAVYMVFAHTCIREPIRIIIGVLILGCLLWGRVRSVNLAALVLAFLWGYSAWIISAGISAMLLGVLLNMTQNKIYWNAVLFIQAATYLLCYKSIRLKRGLPSIDEFEVKGIIFAITGIVLAFFGTYHVTRHQLYEYNRSLFHAAFASLIIVALTGVFLITLFSKRYHERKEGEMYRLALEKDNSELSAKHHRFRAIAKSTSGLHLALINEVKTATNHDSIEKLPAVCRYLDIAKQVGVEFSEELILADFVKEVRGFILPEDWLLLKASVAAVIQACEHRGFSIFAHNAATTWEQIKTPKIKLVRLVDNLTSNAMKELEKTATDDKALQIYFFNDGDGVFTIEITDTAHEFPVQILANLGKRSNSTNGTGNGYAEVFEFLAETGASLRITERVEAGNPKKTIRVAFDDKERVVIRTEHRYEILRKELGDSRVELEKLS